MQLLKLISALLDYPSEPMQQAKDELVDVVQSSREIPKAQRDGISELIKHLCESELMTVQERYSEHFDRGRATSLLLFEHVHGESRDRGQAMVDLMDLYNQNGYHINVRELPDFIPMYLEFLSSQDDLTAREGLADVAHILGLLSARLSERESPYQVLFDALLVISGKQVNMVELKKKVATEERDDTPEAFDKVWQEEQVTFGAGDTAVQGGGCSAPENPAMPKEAVHEAIHWVN
ncbi:nitrate reductase molybdenum cofactor assembly chaperone [Reinekea sp. G2M2-21]|uniref:nitrate reductase molybdenum cofactor assembly chaperone n=1 Tax=Reinekea sp. G2M2-21 TaxID=2788942 RepID=UPI0018A9E2FA|nr:nitrate reductase molybdenum cofactor assembly chaperone [Reinekea sp. G2M2-21]